MTFLIFWRSLPSRMIPIHCILASAQLTKSLEGRKGFIPRAFQNTLSCRAYEEDITMLHLFCLRPYVNCTLPSSAKDDTRARDAFKGNFGTLLIQLTSHDAEFFNGWVVENYARG